MEEPVEDRLPVRGLTGANSLAVAARAACILAVGLLWLPLEIGFDDAWTTYRYAENFAAGKGLVFNPGEYHLGVTATLYALVIGGLKALTGIQLPTIVLAIHLASLLALAFVVPVLLDRVVGSRPTPAVVEARTHRRPGWIEGLAFVVIFVTAPCVRATMGMENVAVVALGLAMVLWCIDDRAVLLGVSLPALCMMRPDGIFLGVTLVAARWLWSRRLPVKTLCVAGLVGLPWTVYGFARYGSPVPATAAAKLGEARSGLWSEHYGDRLWSILGGHGGGSIAILAVLGVVVAIRRRERPTLLVVAWVVLHCAAFSLTGVPAYVWYYVVPTGGIVFLAVRAIGWMLELVRARMQPLPRVAGGLASALVAAAALLHAVVAGRGVDSIDLPLEPRSNRYHQLGRWLAQNTPRDAAVAITEVGIVGYNSDRHIVDLLGLVTPGVAAKVPERTHVAFAMATYRPDYFVIHSPMHGHEAGLGPLVDHGWMRVFAIGDSAVYLRLPVDENEIAARIVAALEARRGPCLVADFPRWLDFERCRAAMAARCPDAPMLREAVADAQGRAPRWVARIRGDGSYRIEPFSGIVAATFDAAAVRERWEPFDLDPADSSDGQPRWKVRHHLSHIAARVSMAGPLRRVRIRFRIESLEPGGGGLSIGTLAWTSTYSPAVAASNSASFPVKATSGVVEVVVDLPELRFGDEDHLERLLFAPIDRPGTFAVDSIVIERC